MGKMKLQDKRKLLNRIKHESQRNTIMMINKITPFVVNYWVKSLDTNSLLSNN